MVYVVLCGICRISDRSSGRCRIGFIHVDIAASLIDAGDKRRIHLGIIAVMFGHIRQAVISYLLYALMREAMLYFVPIHANEKKGELQQKMQAYGVILIFLTTKTSFVSADTGPFLCQSSAREALAADPSIQRPLICDLLEIVLDAEENHI